MFSVNGSSIWNCTGYVIWVDWNQDGVFNNTDERVAYKWESCRRNWTKYYEGYITIPSNARPGTTRMRVAYTGHHYYAQTVMYQGACYSYYYMEWEDYTIQIGGFQNDAGISDIVSPVSKFNSYVDQPVRVVLKNYGKFFRLTQVTINWSVDGVVQQPYYWTGNLDTGATTVVEIHPGFRFVPQAPWNPFVIKAWTTDPKGPDPGANNQPDADPSNDAVVKSIPCILNDAGFLNADGMLPLMPGLNTVKLRIKNYAPKPLSSVYVNYEINGIAQTPYLWTGYLPSQDSIDVVVGEYDFGTANLPVTIRAWTSWPNGYPDEVPENDANTVTVYKALAGGTYSVGGRDPDFIDIIDFTSFISYWGLAGPVVIVIRPGIYEAGITLTPIGGKQHPITFQSLTGRKEDVIIQTSNNYVFELNGYSNVTFKNITLMNTNCTSGRVLTLTGGNSNIIIDNCELIGCANPPKTNQFALIYSENNPLSSIQITNCYLRNGSVAFWATPQVGSKLESIIIDNNILSNQNWQGIHIENATGLIISNNTISGSNLLYGIYALNSSTIIGNRISGVGPAPTTSINDNSAGITLIHSSTLDEYCSIRENVVMTNNSHGIYLNGVGAFAIDKNQVTISTTGSYDKAAILILSSGQAFNSLTACSMVNNNTINATNSHGIYVDQSKNIKFYKNYAKLSGNNKYAYYISRTTSILGQNIATTLNSYALYLNQLMNSFVVYNTFLSNSTTPTVIFNNLSTNNVIKRNVFNNRGTGNVIQVNGTLPSPLNMDENNFFTYGTTMSNIASTFEIWKANTGKDLHSSFVAPVFISDDNPRIIKIDPLLYYKSPLPELTEALWRSEIEETDIDGQPRKKAYYVGVNSLNPKIRIVSEPNDVVNCVGSQNNYFSVVGEIDFGGELYYQWYKDNVPIEGANEAILWLPPLTNEMAGIFRCLITGNGEADPVWTKEVLLYAVEPTKITRQPEEVYVDIGELATFQIDVHINTPDIPYAQPEIQWYRGSFKLNDNDRIAGSKSSILSIRDMRPQDFDDNYYVVVKGLCGEDTSKPIKLAQKPKIIAQPLSDKQECEGNNVQLVANVSSSVQGFTLKYQWRKNGTILEEGAKYSGVNTNTLTINNAELSDAGTYFLDVEIEGFDQKTIGPANVIILAKPRIVTDLPNSLNVEAGKDLTLQVQATGDNLQYQWYKDGIEIPFTEATFEKTSVTTDDAGVYKVKIYNECGEIMSSECVVTVTFKTIQGIDEQDKQFDDAYLFQNTPNPFDNSTIIKFYLPEDGEIRLTVTNLLGEKLFSINGRYPAGTNQISFDAKQINLNPGVYVYTLEFNHTKLSRRMVFIK